MIFQPFGIVARHIETGANRIGFQARGEIRPIVAINACEIVPWRHRAEDHAYRPGQPPANTSGAHGTQDIATGSMLDGLNTPNGLSGVMRMAAAMV